MNEICRNILVESDFAEKLPYRDSNWMKIHRNLLHSDLVQGISEILGHLSSKFSSSYM